LVGRGPASAPMASVPPRSGHCQRSHPLPSARTATQTAACYTCGYTVWGGPAFQLRVAVSVSPRLAIRYRDQERLFHEISALLLPESILPLTQELRGRGGGFSWHCSVRDLIFGYSALDGLEQRRRLSVFLKPDDL